LFSPPPGTKMFQFPGFASSDYSENIPITQDGLSHSGTCGSIRICQSPQIFAACRALLRLREPRHPPYALCNFLLERTLMQVLFNRYSVFLFMLFIVFYLYNFYFPSCQRTCSATEAFNSPSYLYFGKQTQVTHACRNLSHAKLCR
jgi:hypothetical protein